MCHTQLLLHYNQQNAGCQHAGKSNVRALGMMLSGLWENPNVTLLKSIPSRGGSGPHQIRSSLGPPESTTQMAHQSFQPFLQRSCSLETD